MHTSTHSDVGVKTVVAQLASGLCKQLLDARRTWLRNRAPRSGYVHQLRRQMACEQRQSFEPLLAISLSDVDDGIAPSIVAAPYLSVIAIIEERAQQRALARGEPVVGPDPLALVQRESAAQAAKDDAERAFIADPASVEAMRRLLDADADYHAKNDQLVRVVRSKHARLALQVG